MRWIAAATLVVAALRASVGHTQDEIPEPIPDQQTHAPKPGERAVQARADAGAPAEVPAAPQTENATLQAEDTAPQAEDTAPQAEYAASRAEITAPKAEGATPRTENPALPPEVPALPQAEIPAPQQGQARVPTFRDAHGRPEWESLRGVPIADVRIHAGEIFDPEQPGERHFLFQLANALHIRTRPHVIRRELLLDVGDPFDPELAAESERNLRSLGIFQDAILTPRATADGVVLEVRTTDRWTTDVSTDLRLQGGINQLGIGLSEANLAGRAFELGGSVTSSTDVDAAAIGWRDPRLFSSRWTSALALRRDDLQRSMRVAVEHPFYSQTASWTARADFDATEGDRRVFEAEEEVGRLTVTERVGDGWLAYHGRRARLSRWALVFAGRHQRGDYVSDTGLAAVTWSTLSRRFHTARDIDYMGSTEDVATGSTWQIGAGADLRFLGAATDRAFARADAAWAAGLGAHSLIGMHLRQHAFVGTDGDLGNARTGCEFFGFVRTPGVQTLAWRAGAAAFAHEAPDVRFNLGGDDRLRGYPARHLTGTRMAYVNLEERLFTNWRFYFLRFGGVVFADAAAAWDEGETLSTERGRVGFGLGLRIATNRSGSSIAGLDLAFGAGSVQLAFQSGAFFNVARGLGYLDPRPFR
jgi:hypothetical protein